MPDPDDFQRTHNPDDQPIYDHARRINPGVPHFDDLTAAGQQHWRNVYAKFLARQDHHHSC